MLKEADKVNVAEAERTRGKVTDIPNGGRTDVQGLLGPFKDFSSHGRGHCKVLHIGVT